jgi:hypothetical protein
MAKIKGIPAINCPLETNKYVTSPKTETQSMTAGLDKFVDLLSYDYHSSILEHFALRLFSLIREFIALPRSYFAKIIKIFA